MFVSSDKRADRRPTAGQAIERLGDQSGCSETRLACESKNEGRPTWTSRSLSGRELRYPGDWSKQTVVAILGGANIDVTAGAGPDAHLTFVGILGGAKLRVQKGSRITTNGFSFLGGRKVDVEPGDGPAIRIDAWTFFGGTEVTDRY